MNHVEPPWCFPLRESEDPRCRWRSNERAALWPFRQLISGIDASGLGRWHPQVEFTVPYRYEQTSRIYSSNEGPLLLVGDVSW